MRSSKVRGTLSSVFQAVQGSLGVSVTPSHFYFPVPNLKALKEKEWRACRSCSAVQFGLQKQIERLHTEVLPYAAEWTFPEGSTADPYQFHFNNGFFERIDAEIAYASVRHRKPKRVIEVGAGNTTLLLASALR
jgi:hypothetical protein